MNLPFPRNRPCGCIVGGVSECCDEEWYERVCEEHGTLKPLMDISGIKGEPKDWIKVAPDA